jgi:hypothetical protein
MVVSDCTGTKDGWLDQFVRFAVAESIEKRAGGEGVLGRLSELMFVEPSWFSYRERGRGETKDDLKWTPGRPSRFG